MTEDFEQKSEGAGDTLKLEDLQAQVAQLTKDLEKAKASTDKANSEAAGYKRQLREKQTADEAAEEERKAKFQEMTEKLATLEKERNINVFATGLIGAGISKDHAKTIAEAMADGDSDSIVTNITVALKDYETAVRAKIMAEAGTKPPAGQGSASVNYDKLIEEARESGSVSREAYYMRLKAQQEASSRK